MKSWSIWVATWFGCGYAPVAPGTVGSVAAWLPAWAVLSWCGCSPLALLLPVALLVYPAIRAAGITAQASGRKDPQLIVVDEVLGVWIAMAGATAVNWKSMLAALLLFRVFDIFKPQPVRLLESLPGGLGIVADDLMAGVYAALVLWLAGWFNLY